MAAMVDFTVLDTIINELDELAHLRGAQIFEIRHPRAGWGILWYEWERGHKTLNEWGTMTKESFNSHLVAYHYYDTLAEMVAGETERLLAIEPSYEAKSEGGIS